MKLYEKHMSLFDVDRRYYLAHCISGDFKLGKGIAAEFDERFNLREKLFKTYPNYQFTIGASLVVDEIFNLVTKRYYNHKPTFEDLHFALLDMKYQVERYNIVKIAMPYIGSGLDRLSWPYTRCMICQMFDDTEVEIVVCNKSSFSRFIPCQCHLASNIDNYNEREWF